MNYCSIEDAWGKKPDTFNKYMNKDEGKTVNINRVMDNNDNDIDKNDVNSVNPERKNYLLDIEHFNNNKSKNRHNCDDIMEHIKGCRECQIRLRRILPSPIVEKFQNAIDDNKDVIVLVLMGVSILLFFNLINNITKNN
jgi:hypothetical protein